MIAVAILLQLSLWVASTSAFFIWKPCHADNSCTPSTRRSVRTVGGRAAEQPEGVTFEIFRKSLSGVHPRRGRAPGNVFRRHSASYTKKIASRTEVEREGLGKRDNEYAVLEPVKPKAANAAGIYQDENDYAFFVKAEIGSERQPLYLLLDTGAGTTWVMGSQCTTEACELHDTFDPSSSSSHEETTEDFSIGYGTGNVGGDNVVDTIRLGNVEVTMEFGVADHTSDHFKHFAFDGILGMSLNKGSTDNYPQTAKEDKKLSKNMFSVFLSRGSSDSNQGEITLGGINKDKHSGDFTYTDVVSAGHGDWTIPIDNIAVDGKEAKLEAQRNGYVDTGTSYIFGPPGDVKAVHDLVEGATTEDGVTWQVPCDTMQELSITFSGKSFAILPQDWISPPDTTGACTSNVYGYAVVADSWLLGAVFLKNVYTVFDYQGETARIGFAKHAKPEKATAPGTTTSQLPGVTEKPGSSLGVGGPETSTITGSTEPQPASTESADDSPNAAATVSTSNLTASLLAAALFTLVVGFL